MSLTVVVTSTLIMWPWGHLAIGYACYSVLVRARSGRGPEGVPALAAVLGTQFPDLVDKPLAWTFGVLPSGRSLAHSLLVATLVLVVVGSYCRRHDRSEVAVAFGVGYLSHLAGDVIGPFLAGRYVFLSFLGWPLLPPPPYGDEGGFLSHFASLEFSPWLFAQFGFAFLVGGLWVIDGAPGLADARSLVAHSRHTREDDR